MADVKWIKIVTDIFDNQKIKLIEKMPEGDSIIVIWFKILCLAGQVNDGGMIYLTKDIPYTDEMLATAFNKPLTIIKLALNTFKAFEMIEIVDDVVLVSSWEKYQNIDGMERIREQTRLRVAKHRERLKEIGCNATSNATVTHGNAIEKEIEEDKDIKKRDTKVSRKETRFATPSVEEVKAYCEERNNGVDPEAFVDFYESKDWMIGKNRMKDWKAAVRTWERQRSKPKQPENDFPDGLEFR